MRPCPPPLPVPPIALQGKSVACLLHPQLRSHRAPALNSYWGSYYVRRIVGGGGGRDSPLEVSQKTLGEKPAFADAAETAKAMTVVKNMAEVMMPG